MDRFTANWIMIVGVVFISLGAIGMIAYSAIPVTGQPSAEGYYSFENNYTSVGVGVTMFALGGIILIGQFIRICCCWSCRITDGETAPILRP